MSWTGLWEGCQTFMTDFCSFYHSFFCKMIDKKQCGRKQSRIPPLSKPGVHTINLDCEILEDIYFIEGTCNGSVKSSHPY